MSKTQTDAFTTIDNIDLIKLGNIDHADVLGEVGKLAGDYGRFSELMLLSVSSLSAAKTKLDQLEAQIDLQVRKSAEITGEKVTEKKVKSAVESTQAWVHQCAFVDEANTRVERCKAALKTLDKKERMLDLLARFQIREYGLNQRTQ